MDIGKEIKKLRQEKKLSQKDLSHFLGVQQRRISHWEKNSRKITAEFYLKILNILNTKGVTNDSNFTTENSEQPNA